MTTNEMSKYRGVLEATVIDFGAAKQREAIRIERTAGILDRTIEARERELAVLNLESISIKRRDAAAALKRIGDGTFGICLECGETISAARLSAVPWTALCIKCQREADCVGKAQVAWAGFKMAA